MNLAGILEAALKGKKIQVFQDLEGESRLLGEIDVEGVDIRGNGCILLKGPVVGHPASYLKLKPSPLLRFEEVSKEPEKPKGKAPKKND